MTDTHRSEFETFDVVALVSDEGDVTVDFYSPQRHGGDLMMSMGWDEFREVIDFVCTHGLKMSEPYVVEYSDTREAIEA